MFGSRNKRVRISIPHGGGATFRSTVISFQSLTPWQFQLKLMRQFSAMITQQMAAITAQYEAHMKATNENRTQQIQMMLSQIQNPGGAQPGLETNSQQGEAGLQGFHEGGQV